MPRSKKAVMLELPEALLRSYRENCPCRGDQYGSSEPCATCKVQPEALRQLAKMRNRLYVSDASTEQQEKETKRRKQEMEAIQQTMVTKSMPKSSIMKSSKNIKIAVDKLPIYDQEIDKSYSSDYNEYRKMEYLKGKP